VPSRHDPADCLDDIIENGERIEHYLAAMSRDALDADGLKRDAIERCLERICEAAFRLGDRAHELMPGQPWGDIHGMGNRLRHAYVRVNLDVIWSAARYNVPGLVAASRLAVARLRQSSPEPE
jgi:uncharacterized protein with HEPN domain